MNDIELFAITLRDTMVPALEKMIAKEEAHLQFCKDHRKQIKALQWAYNAEEVSKLMLQQQKTRLKEYRLIITNTFGHAKQGKDN